MASQYAVWLSDALGNHLAPLDNFTSLTYTRVRNAPGILSIDLPPSFDFRFIKQNRDARIEVYRGVDGGLQTLDTQTVWFVEMDDKAISQLGERSLTVTAWSALTLLKRRIVAYNANSSQAAKTAATDDMMKAIVRENLGSLATDTTRDLTTYMTVQADLAQGPSQTKQFSRSNVLNVLQALSDASVALGTPIFFDIVAPTPTTLEFRTYLTQRGVDRTFPNGTNPVLLAPQFGNFIQPRLTHDYSNEVNYVYAGGQGQQDQRALVTASDATRIAASPFNRRELFYGNTNATSTAQLTAEANAQLQAGQPRQALTGLMINTPGTQYGKEWKWGDKLTAAFDTDRVDMHVHGVTVKIAGKIETVTPDLRPL